MYTSFYNLNRKPFQISSDPTFMWFGEKHKEALATLKYGILDNKGFLLLTGDVGTGKTTLINALLQSLSHDIICASVPDPSLEKLDFFNYIAAAFGMDKEFSTKGAFLSHFRRFLIHADENNKKVLLIIDEAQLLTQEMLEEVRLLSNIEKTDAKLINIFFVGQNEFNEILNREQNRAVRQRLTLNYNIDPLTPDETGEYIKHRLAIAGSTYPVFDAPATQEVFLYSGGFPRRINVICDHCLLSGYVKDKKTIDIAIVKECANELKIPAFVKNRDINGFAGYHEKQAPITNQKSQTYQIPPEEIQTKRKNKWNLVFSFGVICLFLGLFVFFFIFPNSYKDSMTFVSKNVMGFRYKIKQVISEPYFSFLKQQPGKTEDIKEIKEEISVPGKKELQLKKRDKDQAEREKNHDSSVLADMIAVGEIKPIQEDYLKTGNVPEDIQPVETEDSKTSDFEKKPQDNETIKEIQNNPLPAETIEKVLPLPTEKVIVRFKYNTNDFTEDGFDKLVKFTDILIRHPESKIIIIGYSDSEGYQNYNQRLSEFRANIVRSFFLGKGIKPEMIEVQGLGSQNPVESNDTAWGRMMNRRVEIKIK